MNDYTKERLVASFTQAEQNGTLVIPKHDPKCLPSGSKGYRTVLSHEVAGNVSGFLASGMYSIDVYENNDPKYLGSPYIAITPYPDSVFSIPASGVLPGEPMPSTDMDRIIAVFGPEKGWHIFGGCSARIQADMTAEKLRFIARFGE